MLVVERDESEEAFGDLHLGGAAVAAGNDFDADDHRSAADALDLRIDGDDVAQVDRSDELHAFDRHRRYRALGSPGSGDAAGDVHLAEHPAAEDVAVGVDVAWPGYDAEDRFAGLVSQLSCS